MLLSLLYEETTSLPFFSFRFELSLLIIEQNEFKTALSEAMAMKLTNEILKGQVRPRRTMPLGKSSARYGDKDKR